MEPVFSLGKRRTTPVIEWDEPLGEGGTQRILLVFDAHFDSKACRLDLLRSHLGQAAEEGAPIIFGGDTFDAQGGHWHPGRSLDGVKDEFRGPDYLDRLVNGFVDLAGPVARNVAFMGRGNHEEMIARNNNTDLIERSAERLRQLGSQVATGGIGGWILCRIRVTATTRLLVPVFYHHGTASGGLASKVTRRAATLPEAAVVITGHTSDEYIITVCRDRIVARTGRVYQDEQVHVSSPGYAQTYNPEESSWHSRQERTPSPVGGTWLELTVSKGWDGTRSKNGRGRLPHWKVTVNARRAK